MAERRQPDRDPGPAPQGASTGIPQIETPVIDIQDLEHKPGADTRVNNSGTKALPQTDAPFAKEDEKAREAVAELERELETLPPD